MWILLNESIDPCHFYVSRFHRSVNFEDALSLIQRYLFSTFWNKKHSISLIFYYIQSALILVSCIIFEHIFIEIYSRRMEDSCWSWKWQFGRTLGSSSLPGYNQFVWHVSTNDTSWRSHQSPKCGCSLASRECCHFSSGDMQALFLFYQSLLYSLFPVFEMPTE